MTPNTTGAVSPNPSVVEAEAIATKVADKCHFPRKVGQAPERYAIIWQAARLAALAALNKDQAVQD